ncbi:paladin-like isoform X2 [Apostichopus japonicus]|uniref:paladin-like isoform X2 n=1 Tax=Stichopus japonicus TaxID=307972 RepID=UPI003AB4E6DF
MNCLNMGTGASSSSSRSPSPELVNNQRNTLRHNSEDRYQKTALSMDRWKGQNVISNDIAPIIITKDCFEEYQCTMLTEKDQGLKGCIADGMLVHHLIQEKYFMVADHFKGLDELKTLESHGAPNFRKLEGFPVYGMGQPSVEGLRRVMEHLYDKCDQQEVCVINIRAEPVLFVQRGEDFMPYSPRERDHLRDNVVFRRATGDDISDQEVLIRKEITKYALRDEDNSFYFYENIEELSEEPHRHSIEYDEHIQILEEVYNTHVLTTPNSRFHRLPLCVKGVPSEESIEKFIEVMKDVPTLFSPEKNSLPILAFMGHAGYSRTSFAMILGTLIMAHKTGFPAGASETAEPFDPESRNYDLCEFWVVEELCKLLPNGLQLKKEVDAVVDLLGDISHLRQEVVSAKQKLENIQEDFQIYGRSAKEYYLDKALKHLEQYCYLIVVNSYLHDQYPWMFRQSFTSWVFQRSEIYRVFAQADSIERMFQPELILKGTRFLVADDYLGLDVLSSQREVKVSNFRRVPGLPVYGMSQPNSEGLAKVVQTLLGPKHNHSSIHSFNLRGEVIVELDGCTYTPRELSGLTKNIVIPVCSNEEIEGWESLLKTELIKSQSQLQVYQDVTDPRESKTFTTGQTVREIYEKEQKGTSNLCYYRFPNRSPETMLSEQDIDNIISVLSGLDDIYTDEDGPALLFNCQTGKSVSTVAMAIAGLLIWHKKGFPFGTKLGEQERISVPQAEYTKGEFSCVMLLVRRLPKGSQVKREVDLMLDKCSETMTPMHYHLREIIFSTYNKVKSAKTKEDASWLHFQSLSYLERYIYLILINSYLHMERINNWRKPFSRWMKEIGHRLGVYNILNRLNFGELEEKSGIKSFSTIKERWCYQHPRSTIRGTLV